MLGRLSIQNYALIESLEIDFPGGFSVITGETGAGKSNVLGALGLILGQRSDASFILEPEKKCIVEGTFRIGSYGLEDFFSENELDFEEKCILRREISGSGKSRAFINDTPVSLSVMKSLGDRLLNIHSQHSVITLNDTNFQLAVLDGYASVQNQVSGYRERFTAFLKRKGELDELVRAEQKSRTDRDYYQFLFSELDSAMLKEDEQEELEQKLELLSHAEEIKTSLYKVLGLLSENEQSILGLFPEVINISQNISKFHPGLDEISERLKIDQIDLKDISRQLGKISDEINVDPEEIEAVSARLDLIYRLEKKHHVSNIPELIAIKEEYQARLAEAGSLEQRIVALENELEEKRKELWTLAGEISNARKGIIPELEKNIVSLLVQLGMPDARIRIRHESAKELGAEGVDLVTFLFSSNKGVEPDEVSRIASGGELSRLMLTIKSLVSEKNLLPTIIFDEIDIGVSGEIAGKIGMILKKMAKNMQVIAITHLPQIAGMGETHYQVFKMSKGETTRSMMKKLTHEERIHEIAKMLSNDKVTASASKTASELLKN